MRQEKNASREGMSDFAAPVPIIDRSSDYSTIQEGSAILVDKPRHWTSFKVVRILRRYSGIKKIGHAGTLDPLATGLLICCLGRSATRHVEHFMGLEKEYTGTLRLGQTTSSYDAESDILETLDCDHVTDADLEAAMKEFIGDIQQIPPMFSAIRIDGRRLYDIARTGQTIDRPPRQVHISDFTLEDRTGPDVSFRVVCSKGTYIRSLAHDLGLTLGVGAHIVSLRRTRIGSYLVEDAISAEVLENVEHDA